MLSVFEAMSCSFEDVVCVHICVYMHLSLDDLYKLKYGTDRWHMAMVIYLQKYYIVPCIQLSYNVL